MHIMNYLDFLHEDLLNKIFDILVDLYEKIGLTFYKSKANPAEKVTVKILESWEKRIDKGQRSRA